MEGLTGAHAVSMSRLQIGTMIQFLPPQQVRKEHQHVGLPNCTCGPITPTPPLVFPFLFSSIHIYNIIFPIPLYFSINYLICNSLFSLNEVFFPLTTPYQYISLINKGIYMYIYIIFCFKIRDRIFVCFKIKYIFFSSQL